MAEAYGYETQTRSGWSTGAKVAAGCGVATFIVLILVCGGVIWAANWLGNKVQAFVDEHEAAGFTIVDAEHLQVTSPIDVPTAYVGQSFIIDADASADLAFLCQSATISSHLQGNIEDFNGQMLTLQSGAEIDGDVSLGLVQVLTIKNGAIVHGNIHASTGQMITIEAGAVVEGTITGTWQTINQSPGAIVGSDTPTTTDQSERDPEAPDAPPDDGG